MEKYVSVVVPKSVFFLKQTQRIFLAKVQVFGCWQAGKSFLYIVSEIDQAIAIKAIAGLLIRPWRLRGDFEGFSLRKVVTGTNRNVRRFVDGVKILASIDLLLYSESFSQNILYTHCTVPEENNSTNINRGPIPNWRKHLFMCRSIFQKRVEKAERAMIPVISVPTQGFGQGRLLERMSSILLSGKCPCMLCVQSMDHLPPKDLRTYPPPPFTGV